MASANDLTSRATVTVPRQGTYHWYANQMAVESTVKRKSIMEPEPGVISVTGQQQRSLDL